jgi:hypothetical protein
VCAETSTVFKLQRRISFLTVGIWASLQITIFGTYEEQGVFTIMCKAFDWKNSRISMLEIEVIPQSCIP